MREICRNKNLKLVERKEDYMIINLCGKYCNHAHFKKKGGIGVLKAFMKSLDKGIAPKSKYFKEAAKRLGYTELREVKKEKYINIQKGC